MAIARRLSCSTVLFPGAGAAISAVGGLLCPLSDDVAEFQLIRSDAFDIGRARAVLNSLKKRCDAFAQRLAHPQAARVSYSVEARYAQQIWEIKVPLRDGTFDSEDDIGALIEDFHRLHRDIFAFDDRGAEIEFVNWRARVSADLRSGPLAMLEQSGDRIGSANTRQGFLGGRWQSVPVLGFGSLEPGAMFTGPAFVETDVTTLVVDGDATFRRDESGSLIVTVGGEMTS